MLLFACSDGRLVHVRRRVGSIMAHDGDAVHGVTQLVKGIRCCAGERGMRLITHRYVLPAISLAFLFLFHLLSYTLTPCFFVPFSLAPHQVWFVRSSRAILSTARGPSQVSAMQIQDARYGFRTRGSCFEEQGDTSKLYFELHCCVRCTVRYAFQDQPIFWKFDEFWVCEASAWTKGKKGGRHYGDVLVTQVKQKVAAHLCQLPENAAGFSYENKRKNNATCYLWKIHHFFK
jgi:hypothetical protein